jgi:polyisoprenoid-binding protein YceI
MAWVLDKVHSSVGFAIKHLMISTVRGKFTDFDAKLNLHEGDLALSSIEATVKAGSIDTGDATRDGHVRSADFFDAEKYPYFTFKCTKIEAKGGNRYHVTGNLNIKDTTKEVVFDVTEEGKGKNAWGKDLWAFTAELAINRKDFGLNWNMPLDAGGWMLGDNVKITLDLEVVNEPETVPAAA